MDTPDYGREQLLRAYQRPANAKRVDDRMKLHRHIVPCGGRSYTVITLRPGTTARFSGNYYHDTWHILSDLHGARVLSRLLWGLAYQRVPGTLVLIDRPQLDTEPFSGVSADPIALVPSELTSLPERAAREIRTRLPLTRPAGTVRWQTSGLDAAVAELAERPTPDFDAPWKDWLNRNRPSDSHIARVGGLVVFAGLPYMLKRWAVSVAKLGKYPAKNGMDTPTLATEGAGQTARFRSSPITGSASAPPASGAAKSSPKFRCRSRPRTLNDSSGTGGQPFASAAFLRRADG